MADVHDKDAVIACLKHTLELRWLLSAEFIITTIHNKHLRLFHEVK